MARRPFSISCNLSGMGILTFMFVRNPPGWPRVETACCKPLVRASLSPWDTWSEERPAIAVELGADGGGMDGVDGDGTEADADDFASSPTFCARAFVDSSTDRAAFVAETAALLTK